ncbi:FAD-dependent oxidoreductase [Pseudodesulfovibrio pelocollis]|uniref:FAD-dependent oxidoreductase n=1 Tax=Pseudodesulfovibrio pelocollis TaxID=3051432 RepID=UPI00255A9AD9|nr:FAD-dependent oxidoreductase [Pseudodesulfovibrio sp. SB368]
MRILLIGTDEPGLLGVARHLEARPEDTAMVLYPEFNPLPEFSCMTLERLLGKGIEFSESIRACGLDTSSRTVLVRHSHTGRESSLDYDTLVFATGSAPATLDVPGEFLVPMARVGCQADAARLRAADGVNVVIGSGMHLLLAVSSLMTQNLGTIEIIPHGEDRNEKHQGCLLSDTLSGMVRHHLTQCGVTIHAHDTLKAIEGGSGAVRVVTDRRVIDCARVVNAMPAAPVTYLAADAGITLDPAGHILTDTQLAASAGNVFACGGCAAFVGRDCQQPVPGSAVAATPKAQARALAAALSGEIADFRATAGAWSITFGDLTAAGTGLTPDQARQCGFSPLSALAIQFDRAHFMPDASLMTLELVFDSRDGRVLGIQGLGPSADALAGRISAVSALLAARTGDGHPTVHDVANLEIAYSPPFASAMDVLNTVGNVAANILDGIGQGVTAQEFDRIWRERESGENLFLDCRELGNAAPYLERHPDHWRHIPQGELAKRMAELPRDGRIVIICNTGVRAYEAQVTLKHAGRGDAVIVEGGMTALRQSGVEV